MVLGAAARTTPADSGASEPTDTSAERHPSRAAPPIKSGTHHRRWRCCAAAVLLGGAAAAVFCVTQLMAGHAHAPSRLQCLCDV
jgi:hypothetical protein